jgi:hypothetical protein
MIKIIKENYENSSHWKPICLAIIICPVPTVRYRVLIFSTYCTNVFYNSLFLYWCCSRFKIAALTVWEGCFCIDAAQDSRLAVLTVWEGCFCIDAVRDSRLAVRYHACTYMDDRIYLIVIKYCLYSFSVHIFWNANKTLRKIYIA